MSTIIIQSAIAIDSIRAPEPIYWSSTSHIINVMAEILSELIAETGKYCELSQSIFNCKTIPKITIKKYLERFDLYGRCSQECFVLALIYLDRICEKNTNFFIMRLNIHRLLITSFTVASKFFDEEYFSNTFYAKIGGVSLDELNKLEIEFLNLIDYKLFVDEETFYKYQERLFICEQ